MPKSRVRIRTVMIAAAVAAIILAGSLYDPVKMSALGAALVLASPLLAFVVYYARKLGINTLFR
jgi:hypothetical protein